MKKLCPLLMTCYNLSRVETTTMENCQTEMFIVSLLDIFHTVLKKRVAPVFHACTRNGVPRVFSVFLVFGLHPCLLVDVILSSQSEADHKDHNTFVSDLRNQ